MMQCMKIMAPDSALGTLLEQVILSGGTRLCYAAVVCLAVTAASKPGSEHHGTICELRHNGSAMVGMTQRLSRWAYAPGRLVGAACRCHQPCCLGGLHFRGTRCSARIEGALGSIMII